MKILFLLLIVTFTVAQNSNDDDVQIKNKLLFELNIISLEDKDASVRDYGVQCLCKAENIPWLEETLNSKNPIVRWEVIHILDKLRGEKQTRGVLLRALKNKDTYVQKIAEQSLLSIGIDIIPLLSQALLQEKEFECVKIILKVLEKLANKATSSKKSVIYCLEHDYPVIREQAIKTLFAIGSFDDLLQIAQEKPQHKEQIIYFLRSLEEKALPALNFLIDEAKNQRLSYLAATALGKIGKEGLYFVDKKLASKNSKDMSLGLIALVNMKPSAQVVKRLLKISKSASSEAQRQIFEYLTQHKVNKELFSPYVDDFIEKLNDTSVMRFFAIDQLGEMKIEKASTGLQKIIDNAALGRDLRIAAMKALAKIQPQHHKKFLQFTNDNDEIVAAAAVHILAGMGPQAIEFLCKALRSENWRVLRAAVIALKDYPHDITPALPLLIAILESNSTEVPLAIEIMSSEWDVRIHAAEVLKKMGAKAIKAVPALIKAKNIDYWVTRHHASEALGHIASLAKLITYFERGDRSTKIHILRTFRLLKQKAVAALPAIVRHCTDPKHKLHYSATLTISQMGSDIEIAKDLLKKTLYSSDMETQKYTLMAFKNMGIKAKEFIPDIIEMYQRSSQQTAMYVLQALANIDLQDERVIELLQTAARKNATKISICAITYLAKTKNAMPFLLHAMEKSPNKAIQREAAYLISFLGIDAIEYAEKISTFSYSNTQNLHKIWRKQRNDFYTQQKDLQHKQQK